MSKGWQCDNPTCDCYDQQRQRLHYGPKPAPSAAPLSREQAHVPLPPSAGRIVAMCIFKERLYVAFEYGVYRKVKNGNGWEQILP